MWFGQGFTIRDCAARPRHAGIALLICSIFPDDQSDWTEDATPAATVALRKAFTELAARGHRVIVLSSVPVQRHNAVNMAYLLNGDRDRVTDHALPLSIHQQNQTSAHQMLTAATQDLDGVILRDPASILCDRQVCDMVLNGAIAYTDNNHLNGWGAAPIVADLFAQSSTR